MERLVDWIASLATAPFDLSLRVALVYLAATVAIAFGLWLWRGRPGGFAGWLMPRSVYTHRSNLVDLALFVVGRLVGASGLLGALVVTPAIAFAVLGSLVLATTGSYEPPPVTPARAALATLLVFLTLDFCVYWVHRIHHEARVLWPFHAVHHSAEVLTPLSTYRKHPVYDMIATAARSVLVGVAQAVVLFAVVGQADLVTIGGANVLYVAFNLLGSNFRHSHIWISYGRVLEHVLISPAQHQIHHSRAVEHHNRNYGEVLAIWDWMFGTLYVPGRQEALEFGLADAEGRPIAQPHPTLAAALLVPFRDSAAAAADRFRRSGRPAPAGRESVPPAE